MDPVGFIGLGMMGGAIAQALAERMVPLVVFDIDSDAMDRMLKQGASAAASPKEVADRCEIVFASLPSPAVCREVALGDAGITKGNHVRHYVETSTMGRVLAVELAAACAGRDIGFLDAPVSGGVEVARKGQLASIVSGSPTSFAAARPTIEGYSRVVFELGPNAGDAQLAKLINNAIAIFGILVTFECMAVADQAGLDKVLLIDVINASTGSNFATRSIIPGSLLTDQPLPVGKIAIFKKDVETYLDEARRLGVQPPAAEFLTKLAAKACRSADMDVVPSLRNFFAEMLGEVAEHAGTK